MVSPAPVMRWRIDTAMPGPQRQTVRCGESGRGCAAIEPGSLKLVRSEGLAPVRDRLGRRFPRGKIRAGRLTRS